MAVVRFHNRTAGLTSDPFWFLDYGMLAKLFRRKADGLWRQGDVFIIPVPAVPDDARPHQPVLAEGEVTGHSHRLADPRQGQVVRAPSGSLFLNVTGAKAVVVHDEHLPVEIPRGTYEIRIQREYHPKEIRRVVD